LRPIRFDAQDSTATKGWIAALASSTSTLRTFENGIATPLEEWDAVAPHIAARARVLRYDQRYAPPDGAVAARSVSDVLGDLEKLLTALALKPPFVFVGHSWGGVIARLFTHAHPSDVVGLVFVRRGLVAQLCPPGSSTAYRARIEARLNDPVRWPVGLRTARAESAAIPEALDRLRRDCPDLPPIPVYVLTADAVKSKSAQRVHEGWRVTVARTPAARYRRVPTSSHYMPIECPDVVVDAIFGVLNAVQHERHKLV
jgi:pimeloyl-ACP methyl ester carboxylesterase